LKNAGIHIRVGIDGRDLQIAKTGSKTYLSELLNAAEGLSNEELAFVQLKPFFPLLKLNGKLGKLIKHIQFIWWKQISLPLLAKLKKCDVLICTDYFLPSLKLGIKHLVVFHDAFFWEYPSHYNQFWLKLFYTWAVPAAKRADRILVPSLYVQQRIMHFINVDDHQLSVVYEAPKTFENSQKANGGDKNVKEDIPYLLHVGALSKHKNLPFLIKAFKRALETSKQNWRLILVGGAGNSTSDDDSELIKNTIQEHGLEDKVLLEGYLSDDEVSFYYQKASSYIFPSYNEGFGLPLLEAMRFNLPIAAANNTSLPEIGKDAAIYFDPFNMEDMAGAIQKIMGRDETTLSTLSKQTKVLSSYSWSKAVLEIKAICYSISEYHH